MATTNSFGTLASSGILYSALSIILKRLPFLKNMASDIAPGGAAQYMPFNVATILKNFNANQTVYDRSVTGTYDVQVGQAALADQSVTLDQWPYVAIKLSAVEVNQMVNLWASGNQDQRNAVLQKLLARGLNALALSIVNNFLSKITAANFAVTTAIAAATMDYKKLGTAVDLLFAQDIGMLKPNAILDIVPYRNFVNSLTPVPNYSGVDEAVREGAISEPVSGAQSVTRYNVTQPADAANGFLFDPTGMVFVNRTPIEETLAGNDPVFLEVITEPETGFSILYREFKNGSTGEVTRNYTTLYGFAPGMKNHVLRITES